MTHSLAVRVIFACSFLPLVLPYASAFRFHPRNSKILLTNDDGWAVANIRAQNDALKVAGYNVVLSSPAENESGTGSATSPPTVLNITCEFDTCPIGSPPEGFSASDHRLNYVNSFPVDAVRFGIQTLSPKFLKSKPDFVVSGSNVGTNLGNVILNSGTVGAACEAALEGIPSTAFSARTGQQISFTTLSNTTSPLTQAARIYAALTVKYVDALLALPGRIVPHGITVNVNYPATDNCTRVSDFKFIRTRLLANASQVDVRACGTDHLPAETGVVDGLGCFVSVSVFNASTKADVDARTQEEVFARLPGFFHCLPASE